jgi:hypothetical protein
VIAEPSDEEAVSIEAFVLVLTDEITAAVCEFVLALITAARDVVAVVTSDSVAREPTVSDPSVRFRVANVQMSEAVISPSLSVDTTTSRLSTRCLPTVPAPFSVDVATFQTSAARVPNEVRVLVLFDHTAVGIVAKSDDDAVRTVALVFELIVVITDVS